MTKHLDPLIETLIAVLREALPGCSARDAVARKRARALTSAKSGD